MDAAHGIDPSKMSSGSSAGSVQDRQLGWSVDSAGGGGGGGSGGGGGGGQYGSTMLAADEGDESMYSQWSRGVHEEEQRWGHRSNSSSYLMSQ